MVIVLQMGVNVCHVPTHVANLLLEMDSEDEGPEDVLLVKGRDEALRQKCLEAAAAKRCGHRVRVYDTLPDSTLTVQTIERLQVTWAP